MTEVLPAPGDGASYFASGPLRRSSSHNLISLNTSSTYLHSPAKPSYGHSEYTSRIPASAPSSAPSSPQYTHSSFSRQPSYSSTPASSLSLDTKRDFEDEEDIQFPSFGTSENYDNVKEIDEPHSRLLDYTYSRPKNHQRNTTSSDITRISEDDQALETEPTRHVDYLSHEWREEDIWSSWRYIVSRRNVYTNSVRLENASWRTWAKAKNNLKTVSPEALNWLKDCDVTWLYGPLQTDNRKVLSTTDSPPPSRLSTSSSFLHKKPILKKKSHSEAILQRSICSHSLLKHAGAILQAQEATPAKGRPGFDRATSDFVTGTFNRSSVVNTPAGDDTHTQSSTSLRPSIASSGVQSPGERRHIHFNNEVVQCIALESKDDEEEEPQGIARNDDYDDDDGIVMMNVPSKAHASNRSTPRGSFSNDSKTIARLPSTTLKYRGDTPEPNETQQQSGFSVSWSSGKKLSPSPSQETLRPARPQTNFLIDDDDEFPDSGWQPPVKANSNLSDHSTSLYHSDPSSEDEYDPGPGMRRTPSGMFMPYDEDEEEAAMNTGLFGRVVDTVNTARDIAHVIWNVGWRR